VSSRTLTKFEGEMQGRFKSWFKPFLLWLHWHWGWTERESVFDLSQLCKAVHDESVFAAAAFYKWAVCSLSQLLPILVTWLTTPTPFSGNNKARFIVLVGHWLGSSIPRWQDQNFYHSVPLLARLLCPIYLCWSSGKYLNGMATVENNNGLVD